MAVARFTIVTAVYGPPVRQFERTIASVLGQTFGDWEWCLVDDCSPDDWTRDRLRVLEKADPRIRIAFRESNGGISAATNDAIGTGSGAFVVFLDHDDELERDALMVVDDVLQENPETDFVYSDELVWNTDLGRYVQLQKPGWSPERLRCQNYVNHLTVLRRTLVEDIGGLRSAFDGAQDHDLVLRAGELAREVRHVPRALYRWNAVPGSTVGDPDAKPWAFDAGVRAVQDHCDRVGIHAVVEHGPDLGVYRLARTVDDNPLVSIVIPTNAPTGTVRGQERSFLEETVKGVLFETGYKNVEVLLVPDPQSDTAILDRVRDLDHARVRVLSAVPRPFNFSRKANVGAAHARGEFLLFLNDDMGILHPDWLGEMLAIAQQPDVGAVGAKLYFEDGTLQHAGVYGWHGPGHVGFRLRQVDGGYMGMYEVDRECLAVTGACLLSSTRAFDEVGGFTLALPGNWNDVDLCLKLWAAGLRVVWTPRARLEHFESVSRDPTFTTEEHRWMWSRWARELVRDPFLTPAFCPVGASWPGVTWR
jgi:GT2 family glycosyltransferase